MEQTAQTNSAANAPRVGEEAPSPGLEPVQEERATPQVDHSRLEAAVAKIQNGSMLAPR